MTTQIARDQMKVYRDDIKSWFSLPRADKVYVNKTDGGKVKRTSVGGGAVHFSDTHECWWNCEETEDGMIHHHSTDDCDKNHVEIEYSKADVMDEQWTERPPTKTEIHPDEYEFQPEGRIWKPTSTDLDLSEWVFEHQEGANSITLDGKIIVDCENTPMLLHEIAHAITGEGHTGYFADRFTELVKLNMEDTSTDDLELGTTNAEATKYYLFGHRKALDLAIQFMFEKLGEDKDGKDFKRWLKAREDE